MTPKGPVLRAVTGAAASAAGVTDLQTSVCEAVVDAGYDGAYLYDGDAVLASAGDASDASPTDEPPAGVESVDADGTIHVFVPVVETGTRHATLVLVTDAPLADANHSTDANPLADGDSFPDDDTREFLLGVGETLGRAIGNANDGEERVRLETALEDERRQFEKLHSVAAQMVGRENRESIYRLTIDAAENILDFDICGIDVVEGDYLVPKALSTGMESGDSRRIPTDEGIAGKTYQENERIIVDDVTEVTDAEPANSDYRSLLSVPVGDVGVFQAASERVAAFSDQDAELAELLMAHVAETMRRLRSDEALRESEAKYRTLIEQSHDAVAILQDGGYEFVNNRATELFGRDEASLLSADAWELLHTEDRETVRELQDEVVVEVGRQRTFEARIRRPSGDVRYCEFSVTSIDYEGDVAALASIRDITERKEHERELQRQNERLDEFASVVSHDLRSPINVARGSVDLARTTGDDEHLDRADEALERMESMVEDVLELARQGQLVDDTESVELASVATDAWESVDAPDATLDVDADGARVSADPGRLQELFENLFRNAVEHAGDDVTVTVEACSEGFAVTDDGPGIPADVRDHVFERGFSSTDAGTGFGLAIVENIVHAHDWQIAAVPPAQAVGDSERDAGRGARFEITNVSRVE